VLNRQVIAFIIADRAAADMQPKLEVRRVVLEDGLHASIILENGRMSKLVSPSGEVAVLQWEDTRLSPRQPVATAISRARSSLR